MRFGAGQTLNVVNRYSGGWWVTGTGCAGFNYVLKTGASWKGKIGRARIICDIKELTDCAPIRFSPKGAIRRGNVVQWDLRNFEPKEDVWVQWFDGFAQVRLNGKQVMTFSNDEHLPYWAVDDPRPRKVGREVWLAPKTLAEWLHVTSKPAGKNTVRYTWGPKWLEMTGTRGFARTRQGVIRIHRLQGPNGVVAAAPLSAVVKALGGTTRWTRDGWLDVTLSPRSARR